MIPIAQSPTACPGLTLCECHGVGVAFKCCNDPVVRSQSHS